jgi:Uma2 family endonuclease
MATATRLTPDDLLKMPDDGHSYELVDGELQEIEMSKISSRTALRILARLERHVESKQAGWLFPADTGFTCFSDSPGMVRKPDGAFISLERMTVEEYQAEGYCEVVPDFVIEVNSPGDKVYDVIEKRELWLETGVRLVWIVDPADKTVTAYQRDGSSQRYLSTDSINGDPVLPGFQCQVEEFFKLPVQTS